MVLMVLVVRSILRPATDPVRAGGPGDVDGDPEWPATPAPAAPAATDRPVLSSSAPRQELRAGP